MESKQRYKELVTKRASAKGQITKFKNYLNNISKEDELSDIQLTELTLKLAKFEALSVRVDELQNDIEVLNPDNIDAEIDERDNIEKDIIVNIATAKNLLEMFSRKNESEQRRNSVHNASCCTDDHHSIGLRLPQIQIAKFNGEYFRWLEFRDTFESLIHNNDRISEINKFYYLNSYLEGNAARIVSNLEVSSKNYAEAWKLLCQRYNNNRILINHHLNSLLNIKPLPRDSEKSLRFLVDHITKNLRALASLGQPTDNWDVLIIFLLSAKLDSQTLLKWEEHRNSIASESPSLDQFCKFIINRANVLEATNRCNNSDNGMSSKTHERPGSNNSHQNNQGQRKGQNNIVKSFASTDNNNKKHKVPKGFSCIICDDCHRIYDCPTFKSKSIDERMSDVTRYKLCLNCLRQGHAVKDCRFRSCLEPDCNERHNSLLHRPTTSTHQLATLQEPVEVVTNFCNKNTSQIILSTAMVVVSNPFDHQKVKVRALLDCGSQSSFITESLKTRLKLSPHPIDTLKVIGIGNTLANNVTESCNIRLQSVHNEFKITCSCLVLKELTGRLPKAPIDIGLVKLPKDIQLADPTFHQPAAIDILIGADLFWDILGNKQISLGVNEPKLRSSQLGWIVSGPIQSVAQRKVVRCNHSTISSYTNNDDNIEKIDFWDLEDIPKRASVNENECETHFLTVLKRDHFNFLLKDENVKLNVKDPEVIPELKAHSVIINKPIIDFDTYSSLTKLQRSFAYVRRFIHNVKNKHNKRTGTLSVNELRESFYSLCAIAQGQMFPIEHNCLLEGKSLANKSKILSLSPFLDEHKLIRVGGRIDASAHSYEKKHPILLHASHRLTKLYFEREHN
ncbi:hypothetical protein PYW08_015954 [Mythimna loreyi]|uniref:Uncharacterized protein n=1 Tax=Mythimna loreyi TaxID=667449 RepID=A0ACC2QWD3_9NEOP|nr:hypothetical protein PYW08_015954 [Mythimna loreyi]